ncbi:TolC family outer membrane protein [Marinomonas algarum]|uniref:TolC family outer membrane protein n=1 Tax=Marinomonas algarum TaxID=2883105 RepID=A0A9X1IMB3_9GAMM|nr:TolC family outer membrane protein [Marinomonas algarum]MCB5161795.1 TolC family outer membrane protein [Marinomonas algarum]
MTCTAYVGMTLLSSTASAISLEQATYTAIENSPTVRQAIATYRESQENADIARRSGYYPSIDLSAGIGRETTYADESSSDDISLTRRELTLSLNQPIFDGFSTKNDVERLNSEAEADRWDALIAVENTALEVAQVYANILRYRELVSLAELNLKTHDRIYGQIKLKSDSGIGRQSDLNQITARLAKAQANYASAMNNLINAESNYNNIVGELPPEELIYPVPDQELVPQDLESAIQASLQKNPAIEGAYWDIEATKSLEKATEAEKYPTINFVLERTWDDNIDGDEGASEDLLAMVRLNYNLYNGGTYKRRKEAAVQQSLQASEIRRKTIRDTELTVRLSWAAYEATSRQKEFLKKYVIATKESQLAYEKQFRLGRRTLLDVLDSENELFQARQDYVNADYDQLFSEFRLFNAKGELMRAFRIYRPQLLGFEEEFVKPVRTVTEPVTALDELKAAEEAANTDALNTDNAATVKPTDEQDGLTESDLFLDADQNSNSW